jgi:hypothetical protein
MVAVAEEPGACRTQRIEAREWDNGANFVQIRGELPAIQQGFAEKWCRSPALAADSS